MRGALALEIELDAATICFFFVLKAQRRRGVGASLMQAARRAARTRGVTTIYLEAPAAASAFLRKAGFTAADASAAPVASAPNGAVLAWRLDISRDGVILR